MEKSRTQSSASRSSWRYDPSWKIVTISLTTFSVPHFGSMCPSVYTSHWRLLWLSSSYLCSMAINSTPTLVDRNIQKAMARSLLQHRTHFSNPTLQLLSRWRLQLLALPADGGVEDTSGDAFSCPWREVEFLWEAYQRLFWVSHCHPGTLHKEVIRSSYSLLFSPLSPSITSLLCWLDQSYGKAQIEAWLDVAWSLELWKESGAQIFLLSWLERCHHRACYCFCKPRLGDRPAKLGKYNRTIPYV